MIRGFDHITQPLNDYEKQVLLPKVIAGLKNHYGRANAITSDKIIAQMKAKGFQITGVRLRKIIHHIRQNALLVCVVGDCNGYYVSSNVYDIEKQIESLRGREESIRSIRKKLEEHLKKSA